MSKEHQPEAQLPSEPNICPKCNQAYIETHICTAESNQSFERVLHFYGDLCAQYQSSLEFGITIKTVDQRNLKIREAAKAALAAHESDKAHAVRAARIDEARLVSESHKYIKEHGVRNYALKRTVALTKGESNE